MIDTTKLEAHIKELHNSDKPLAQLQNMGSIQDEIEVIINHIQKNMDNHTGSIPGGV